MTPAEALTAATAKFKQLPPTRIAISYTEQERKKKKKIPNICRYAESLSLFMHFL